MGLGPWYTINTNSVCVRERERESNRYIAVMYNMYWFGISLNSKILNLWYHDLNLMQISDMVAVARLMNATLVIPQLDKRSFWRDSRFSLHCPTFNLCWSKKCILNHLWICLHLCTCSTFSDIFDEPHFIKALEGDVHIVPELPKEMETAARYRKHFTSWSSASYYEEISLLLKDYQVAFNIYVAYWYLICKKIVVLVNAHV